MTKTPRYLDLTEVQTQALTDIAFGSGGAGVGLRTLRALEFHGLITASQRIKHDRFGELRYLVYEMPIWEHVKFCQWCEENYEEPPVGAPLPQPDDNNYLEFTAHLKDIEEGDA